MKIELNQHLWSADPSRCETIKLEDGSPATARRLLADALFANYHDEKIDNEIKYKRYKLGLKIREIREDEIELTAEQVVELKDLVARAYSTLVMGRLWDILEGNDNATT